MGISFIGAGAALSSINLVLGMAFMAIGVSNIIAGLNHRDEWLKK